MSWRWRKSIRTGPFRINITKRGVGYSVGIPGLRYGRSPQGRKYVSQSIPGTGLYRIKYLGAKMRGRGQATLPSQTTVPVPVPTQAPVPAPSTPSPMAVGAGRTTAALGRGIGSAAHALGLLIRRVWVMSTDRVAIIRLRWQARGWSPPPAPASPPITPATGLAPIPASSWLPSTGPVAPPAAASPGPTSPPPVAPPSVSWLPSPSTTAPKSPSDPAAPAPSVPPIPTTPADPWWKDKPRS
jgi:hypothetical protein